MNLNKTLFSALTKSIRNIPLRFGEGGNPPNRPKFLSEQGSLYIEAAVLLPVFFLIVFGTAEIGNYYVQRGSITNVAQSIAMAIQQKPDITAQEMYEFQKSLSGGATPFEEVKVADKSLYKLTSPCSVKDCGVQGLDIRIRADVAPVKETSVKDFAPSDWSNPHVKKLAGKHNLTWPNNNTPWHKDPSQDPSDDGKAYYVGVRVTWANRPLLKSLKFASVPMSQYAAVMVKPPIIPAARKVEITPYLLTNVSGCHYHNWNSGGWAYFEKGVARGNCTGPGTTIQSTYASDTSWSVFSKSPDDICIENGFAGSDSSCSGFHPAHGTNYIGSIMSNDSMLIDGKQTWAITCTFGDPAYHTPSHINCLGIADASKLPPQKCPTGQVMSGVTAAGKPICQAQAKPQTAPAKHTSHDHCYLSGWFGGKQAGVNGVVERACNNGYYMAGLIHQNDAGAIGHNNHDEAFQIKCCRAFVPAG